MIETVFTVVLLGSLALHAWTVYQYKQERKDLLTRIMARDLAEYQAVTNMRPLPKSSSPIRNNIARHFEVVEEDARNN